LAPALVFIAAAIDRNYQTDLWHHLARGRLIAAEGRMINDDRFTYTVGGRPLQDANWAWQVAHFGLFTAGGLPLVQTVNALVLAAAMAVLLVHCRRRSGSLSAATLVCVVAFFGLWQLFLIRPQTFSLLFFVLLHACLQGALVRPRLLWLPPILLAVWANVHGGFPVGLVLIGCYTVAAGLAKADDWRGRARAVLPWAGCLAAAVAATCINPYGWHVYEYVLQTSRTASARRIDEWLPPGLNILTGKVWALSVLGLLALFALRPTSARERRWLAQDLVLIACFLPAACGSVRMIAWWLLVSAPLLTELLADVWPALRRIDSSSDRPTTAAALTTVGLLLAMIVSLPWLERYNPIFQLPGRGHRTESDLQQITERLASAASAGRVFSRFEWGEYVGWELEGRWKVCMDGRIEIYPDDVWAEYSAVTRGRADWEQVLEAHGIEWLLLDAAFHGDLLPQVERSHHWQEVLRQGDAVLYTRRSTDDRPQGDGGRALTRPLRQSP
jgi:hypothetical protein